LVNRTWRIPSEVRAGEATVKPFLAGEEIGWQLAG
jgi:dihydroorotase